MANIQIEPAGSVSLDLAVQGSKSLTNRALIAAALAPGLTKLTNASFSDDSKYLATALNQIGIPVETRDRDSTILVQGGKPLKSDGDFFMGNAGTALRFFTSFACLGKGQYEIDGEARMRERPIGGLVEALRQLGAEIRYEMSEGSPPLAIRAQGLKGGRTIVSGDTSSQFISSLLLSAPGASGPVEIEVEGEVASKPYIEITLDVMRDLGVAVEREGYRRFRIPPGSKYQSKVYKVEADGASANYFLAMAATTAGKARVRGVGSRSHQGELKFAAILEQMGCTVRMFPEAIEVTGAALRGVDVDMNDCPDSVQTLAAVALFAKGVTRVRNVKNLRVKETDRIAAIAKECGKLGAHVDEMEDGFALTPPQKISSAEIDTYKDHRMAMSFAVVAVAAPGIVIRDPDCVSKSFPGFFEQLGTLGIKARRT
ncbi:MAG TPA: 3-phosphoshikimate 1-carboxyvinyltransferase [Planctomycetota bacterium]|nr:3-phosphoshikimate 1-carboxyvinyltransferase [Planctomycetota bacterium]